MFPPFSLPLSRFPPPSKLKILMDNLLTLSMSAPPNLSTKCGSALAKTPLQLPSVRVLPGGGTLSIKEEDPAASDGQL